MNELAIALVVALTWLVQWHATRFFSVVGRSGETTPRLCEQVGADNRDQPLPVGQGLSYLAVIQKGTR